MPPAYQEGSEDEYSPPEDNLDPELVLARVRAFQSVPVTLIVDPPRSKEAQERIDRLKAYARGPRMTGPWDGTKLQLSSAILGNPLTKVWSQLEPDSDSEIEYELHETEEEWKAWVLKAEAKRAKKAARKQLQKLDMTMAQGLTTESPILRPTNSSQPVVDPTILANEPDPSHDDGLAPVVDWNEDSLVECFQSTPKRPRMAAGETPRQLASPPETRDQPLPSVANGPAASPVLGDGQITEPFVSNRPLSQRAQSLPKQPMPITPLSPNGPRLERFRANQLLHGSPTPKTASRLQDSWTPMVHKGDSQRDGTSPATTAFLYGSKTPAERPRCTQEVEDSNGYARELEAEAGRLTGHSALETSMYVHQGSTRDQDPDSLKYHGTVTPVRDHGRPRRGKNTITTSPGTGRGTWDLGESFGGLSQDTRAISAFVEEDIGEVYRDDFEGHPW